MANERRPAAPQPARPNWRQELAQALGVPAAALGRFWGRPRQLGEMYSTFEVPKKHDGVRTIAAPAGPLKRLQRRIYERLLAGAWQHDACCGFRRGRGIVDNARRHVGQELVINVDLRDFFPTITAPRVYGVFRRLGQGHEAAVFLTSLTTREGTLPQGAPTSPALANLVCRRLDARLQGLAARLGAAYSRYADDLTFSGPAGLERALPLIREIIGSEHFTVAQEKLRLMRQGRRQEVTGLVVNEQVSVPRAVRRRLRSAVHHRCEGRPLHWEGAPLTAAALAGHLAYLNAVQPEAAAALRRRLDGGGEG